MAAGLGFKTFTTGEVLTAADVNGYLMQGILVFANAAARTSAITSPQEGQYSFLKDTNALEYYDGAAWVGAPVGDITAVNAGTGITGGGASGSVTITNDMATTITAAGDIVVGTGNATYDNLPIGTTGQVLTADTTVSPYKVKWATPAAGASFKGALVYVSSSQSIANSTDTYVTFAAETFDTDSFHDNATNNTRLTIPTGLGGKYLFTAIVGFDTNTTGRREAIIFKNRTTVIASTLVAPTTGNWTQWGFSQIIDASAGDYFELRVWQNSGGSLNLPSSTTGGTTFACQYLGA